MSADAVIFNPLFSAWIVLSLSALLLVFFIVKEIQRKGRFLFVRIMAQLVVVISLACMVLRPSYLTEKTAGSVLLLTKGYQKETADSLVKLHQLRVIRSPDAAAYPHAEVLPAWHSLDQSASDIRFVTGEGIPLHALEATKNLHFDYVAGHAPEGITQLKAGPFKINQKNFVDGEFHSASAPTTLKLIGPGGAEDSVQLKTKGYTSFRLAISSKQAGKFIYQITSNEEGVITTSRLPVEVLPEKPLNILFLLQYPSFEARYLKNYLGEKGHAVILRYQVSKNTYRYEYANREKQEIPRLSHALLNAFDLLITTPGALQSLSSAEAQSLESSSQEGLGMLLLVDQAISKKEKFFPFELLPVKTDTVKLASEQWKGQLTLPATPLRIAASASVEGVFHDHEKKIVTGYFYTGSGKTGFQFLNETYRLALEGKTEEYAGLWSPLISEVARTNPNQFKIKITSPFPWYPNQPVHFEIISSGEAPQLQFDNMRLPVKEDVTVNQLWHGQLWASESGWHQLALQDSTHLNFYISSPQEWHALNEMNQQKINRTYQAHSETEQAFVNDYQPVSPLLCFILFVMASGALWLAAKL